VPSWIPVGPEFRANTTTEGDQGNNSNFPHIWNGGPSVTMDSAGNSVIAWWGQGAGGEALYGQRYDSAGNPAGSEFQINSTSATPSSFYNKAAIASSASGGFVVAWAGATALYARQFNALGSPLGNEITVDTGDMVSSPRVACDTEGNFVVAYVRFTSPAETVFARRFDVAGASLGPAFQVSASNINSNRVLGLAMNEAGQFIVSWDHIFTVPTQFFNYVRRYDSDGQPMGSPILTYSSVYPTTAAGPRVGIDATGAFVVAWWGGEETASPPDREIYARRFDAAGIPLGQPFRVNTFLPNTQLYPEVAMQPSGSFTVTWFSHLQDGSSYGVYGQCYRADGTPEGDEFRVNTHTPDAQRNQAFALNAAGNAVVAWASIGQDGSGWGVYAQRFTDTLAAPAVASVRVNDGSAQRSRVMDLTVTFSTQVTFAGGNVSNAFTLIRDGGKPVSFSATSSVVNGVTVVTLLNFTGASTQSGSLADGRYTLTVLASQVSANSQQMLGNHVVGSAQGLFRMFGDINGDKQVDGADFGALSSTYGLFSTNPNFLWFLDVNGDGQVDGFDFGQFSGRFNTILP
jgi:hypothetical protein